VVWGEEIGGAESGVREARRGMHVYFPSHDDRGEDDDRAQPRACKVRSHQSRHTTHLVQLEGVPPVQDVAVDDLCVCVCVLCVGGPTIPRTGRGRQSDRRARPGRQWGETQEGNGVNRKRDRQAGAERVRDTQTHIDRRRERERERERDPSNTTSSTH
jgi:hypothetical protein